MGWFGESTAHKQARYQKEANKQLQQYNLENMEIQQGYNIENMARQFDYEQLNMAQQFDYQKQAFNMENSYNTPAQQRARMEQAGLNPNWSDAQSAIGQMDAGVQPIAPSGGSPSGGASGSASPPSLASTAEMKDIIGMMLSKKQADLMQSEIDLNKSKQANELSTARLNEVEIGERPKNYRSSRTSNTYDQWLKQSQMALNDAQKIAVDKTNEWIDSTKEASIKRIMAEIKVDEATAKKIAELLEYDKRESASRTALNLSNIWKNQMDVQNKSRELTIMGKQVAVAEGTLSELHRHNVSVESYERFATTALGQLNLSNKAGQDIRNKMWDIEGTLMRVAVKEGIPQQLIQARLWKIRSEIHNIEQDTEFKKASTHNQEEMLGSAIIKGLFDDIAKSK